MSIQLIQQAICYMEKHILEDISYVEVAKNMHMSSYNFHRTFSSIVGMTANGMFCELWVPISSLSAKYEVYNTLS